MLNTTINSIGTGSTLAAFFYVLLMEPFLAWLKANRGKGGNDHEIHSQSGRQIARGSQR